MIVSHDVIIMRDDMAEERERRIKCAHFAFPLFVMVCGNPYRTLILIYYDYYITNCLTIYIPFNYCVPNFS